MHCRAVIERMFGRLKDWRRISTRYDRSPTVFLSAIALAAAVIFWLWVLNLRVNSLQLRQRWLWSDFAANDALFWVDASQSAHGLKKQAEGPTDNQHQQSGWGKQRADLGHVRPDDP
jgi:hypothetical protein